MMTFLFLFFAAVSVVPALFVITRRSPLYSALFLAITLTGQAGLFTLLGAFFVGIIQILIYAGAIMILFLFVIMSLDPEEGRSIVSSTSVQIGSGLVVGVLIIQLFYALAHSGNAHKPVTYIPQQGSMDHVALLGKELFSTYLVPFEIGSVLLLVAVLGAVVLAHRHRRRA
ncbi:MAG: NADH-quinone oxidoreductase subunit J [Candidatus Glassbacteria bacterium]